MKHITFRAGSGFAASAAATSVALLFVPYGHPWASLAWAVVACATAVAMGRVATRLTPRMSDVVSAIEAEPSHAHPDSGGGARS
jgi:hypothetical protein